MVSHLHPIRPLRRLFFLQRPASPFSLTRRSHRWASWPREPLLRFKFELYINITATCDDARQLEKSKACHTGLPFELENGIMLWVGQLSRSASFDDFKTDCRTSSRSDLPPCCCITLPRSRIRWYQRRFFLLLFHHCCQFERHLAPSMYLDVQRYLTNNAVIFFSVREKRLPQLMSFSLYLRLQCTFRPATHRLMRDLPVSTMSKSAHQTLLRMQRFGHTRLHHPLHPTSRSKLLIRNEPIL